jgi:hypothetical protein
MRKQINTNRKTMKKITFILLSIFSVMIFYACEDFLDKEVDTSLTDDMIFSDNHYAPGFLNNIYNNLLPGYNRLDGAMLASGSDEAVHSNSASLIHAFNNGAINPGFNPDDVWDRLYEGIRKTNVFLERLNTTIAETNSIPVSDRPRMKGEAIFLRAMFHFELAKRYGNIPYIDQVLNEDNAGTVLQLSFNEVAERIVADCDTAYVYLPLVSSDDNRGRATKAATKALKSRVLLYAASPLNNPGNDLSKWERAADAALYVINMAGPTIGLATNYAAVFNDPWSREILFATAPINSNAFESLNFPLSYGGLGYTNPTQNLANAFDTRLGRPIDDDPAYDPANPLIDREERFYNVLLHNMAVFKGSPVETFVGGRDGLGSAATATRTGYYIRKFSNSSVDLDRGTTVRKPWILFRYAEAYLNYAEAMNEAYGPVSEVYDAVFLLRRRNHVLPARARYPQGMNQNQMRQRLKKERQIEFAFEEHRFWDLRRWLDAENVLNEPIRGLRITQDEQNDEFQHEVFVVENRTFDPKFYWYPIPRKEVLKGYLEQNQGW